MKISQAVIEYLDYVSVTKSSGTQDFYKQYFREIAEVLGNYDCDDISNNVIVSFIKSQKNRNQEIANTTLNKYVGAIKSLVSYTNNRSIKFSKLKEQKKIIPTISMGTINKIFNYYQKNMGDKNTFRNYVFLKLLLDTGLRMSEIRNIKLKYIDFETNSIHVQVTKTDVDRYVCFTESTSNLLKKFIVVHNIKEYIFFEFPTNNLMTTSSVESFVYRIKKKLNISESITPHKWRHTFATTFIKNGGDLETLRLLLGHSNLKTTQKYLHLSRNDIVNNYRSTML